MYTALLSNGGLHTGQPSRGNFIYSSEDFQTVAKIMEEEFLKFHDNSFSKESAKFDKITDHVILRINEDVFPRVIIHCLVRIRISVCET